MHTRLDYDSTMAELDRLTAVGGDRIHRQVIGASVQGRPLVALNISNPQIEDEQKERAVLTAGHHGMEPGGVRGCLKTLSWLLDGEGQRLLDHVVLLCFPMVNPDGLAADDARNANGVNLDINYQEDGLTEPESRTVWKAVSEFEPEAAIDMHNYAATHSSVYIHPRNESPEDEEIANRIAKRIYEHCEQYQFPMWEPAWLEGYPENRLSLSHRCYQEFHTFPIVTETNEAQFEPEEEAECGRLMASTILELVAETWPGQCQPGFPVGVIKSGYSTALYACGETTAERRQSRIEHWSHRDFLEVRDIWPETPGRYRVILETVQGYWHPKRGVGLRIRLPKDREITAVERDGVKLSKCSNHVQVAIHHNIKEPSDNYRVQTDACSTYIYVNIAYLYGCTDIVVHYQRS